MGTPTSLRGLRDVFPGSALVFESVTIRLYLWFPRRAWPVLSHGRRNRLGSVIHEAVFLGTGQEGCWG